MSEDIAVSADHLAKYFKLPHERKSSIKEWVLHFNRPSFESFHALKDINFEVKRGEFFGIVGRNGSGKSTLLKTIGGIYQPTKGKLKVNGTLTPFIELGIGFNPELTGRDNIYLNGAILGLTHKEIKAKYREIVAFAELENFMDQKLKNYSSGMQVRLAFSIAMQAHNDILLIDEVLAVGDASFQRKCFEMFKEIKQSDKTVIFVSHDMNAVKEYCDRAILIEKGLVISAGDPDIVANDYLQLFVEDAVSSNEKQQNRWGDRKAIISDIDVAVKPKEITIACKLTPKQEIENPIAGLIIKDLDNHHVIESNTVWKKMKMGTLSKGSQTKIVWTIPNIFKTGRYTVTIAAAHEDGVGYYDWHDQAMSFRITRSEDTAGLIFAEHTIAIKTEAKS